MRNGREGGLFMKIEREGEGKELRVKKKEKET